MSSTSLGEGIEPVETPMEMSVASLPGEPDLEKLVDRIKAGMRHEMDAAVADIERRLAQAREIEASTLHGIPRQTVHTEDLNIGKAMIDGYTLTANSPTAGSIAWASLHVVLGGVDYTITDANTPNKYAWFIKPGSGTSTSLQTGNTLPTLGPSDALIFINNGGVPVSVLESSITYAVGPGAIGNSQLDTATKDLLTTLQQNDLDLQAALDGAITTYFSNEPPWPSGSPNDGDMHQGDVWYDSNDGGAFRWSGATGTPANTWVKIADTDNSALEAKVNTKVTTYLRANESPPVAPAGGFTEGDMWMVTDMGNRLKRWSGSAWVDVLMGDGAISGVSGAKIGSGINATNITTGVVNGTLVGSGVAPSVLTGSGTAPIGAIPQLTPAKLNTAFHMLY